MKKILALCLLVVACSGTDNPEGGDNALLSSVDAIVKPYIDSAKIAGVAVGVFRNGEPVVMKGYGYADLEFDIKLPATASFEIGSVTKQFTAVAILQLVEAGKLGLDDDITKYLAFDTKGKKVTVKQLMTHTSGIQGYTEMPVFFQIAVHKYKRDTLLQLVGKEPFNFEPGDALVYNNTGFFMLGLIIEKVSGLSYEEYVRKNLFEKAGMTNSSYCSESKIVKNRAHGYEMGEGGLQRASYLDHTWPYAAGSLCSTVEDLSKWNSALHHGKILGEEMYQEFISPTILNNGSATHYAKGITVVDRNGRRSIAHGGAINGFFAENTYFPDDDVSVIVLMNTTGPVRSGAIESAVVDKLFPKPSLETATFAGDLSKYKGKYIGPSRGEPLAVLVSSNDSTLTVQHNTDKPKALTFVKDNSWTDGHAVYEFAGSAVEELRIDQTYGYLILKKE
jgi:CubicO group peptidase (beta-lactamase class C family)